MSLFFDMDHDGDLDFFEARSAGNLFFRNNSDGTFQDHSAKLDSPGNNLISRDAAFGDFDEDEDIDFIVVNENIGNILYSNQRQGVFKDISDESGLNSEGGSCAVTVGDYNNDGYLDIFIASLTGDKHRLYQNLRNGSFDEVKNIGEIFSALQNVKVYDAAFLDFDNDGFLDLLIAGESAEKDGKGLFLYHNDGKENFTEGIGC
jgi:predicted nucleotidyltransferase